VPTIHHRSRFLMVGTLSLCPPCGPEGAARDVWLGAMGLQACNEERRSEILFSWADRRAVMPFC
jgi:hypothetical protein